MGKERLRIEDKYPLYRGAKDDRSNLELLHNRLVAQAIRYSQNAIAVLAVGVAFFAFPFYFLDRHGWIGFEGFGWIEVLTWFVWFGVFLFVLAIALKRFFYSWLYSIQAEFVERKLGVAHTWKIKQFDDKFEQFKEYEYDEKLKQLRERRYYIFIDKIFKRIKISKYIP